MRVVASWGDVCILNISARGMQLQAARTPERGTYIEIRRGAHVIIGCVAWAKQHRFGIKSQDALFVDAIVAEPGAGEAQRAQQLAYAPVERRRSARPPSGDCSRLFGRAFEFACVCMVALGGAMALYAAAAEAFAKPMASVSQALGD